MTDQEGSGSERILAFGPFRLVPSRKVLLEGEAPLRLGSRALDILVVLADRAGQVVAKDDLVANVWPDTFVDDANLRVNIAALRKALGEGRDGARYITNVPGRGYCFVAPVVRVEGIRLDGQVLGPAVLGTGVDLVPHGVPTHNLPVRLTRIVGRAAVIQALGAQLPARRFVTVVGPGGIGKTTVALALAETLAPAYEHGVRFIDFAPLTDAALVSSALAGALGASVVSDDPIPDLAAFLQDKRLLLVLDNCEHVVGTAAILAETVLRTAPGVHILATSREPLRAEGEWVQRLASLEIPPVTAALDVAQALSYSAVQLFVERATASVDTFSFGEDEVPLVIEICRGLDGIPLAIELAAARLDLFGLRGLACRLNDRFALLVRGRRTALPRHQTLRAMLDWSYELLPATERLVLHRLSVFAGGFTVDSAAVVAGDTQLGPGDVLGALSNLVAKSLLSADVSGIHVHYKLLEMTKAYALEKLVESGERDRVVRRHAECHRDLMVRAEAEWDSRPTAGWLEVHGPQIDNVRVALAWALGPDGDADIGIALTAAAVPLWMQLSLMNECREGVRRALDQVRPGVVPEGDAALDPAVSRDAALVLRLQSALGTSLIYTKGPGAEVHQALARSLALAERLDDIDYQLRAHWGLFVEVFNEARYAQALAITDRLRALALRSADPVDLMMADRLRGFALHLMGDHAAGRSYIEDCLRRYVRPAHRGHLVRYQYDQRIAAFVPLSVILWIQGFPDQAHAMVETAVAEGQAINHALSLGYILATAACQVACFTGDLATADRFTALLQEQAVQHGLGPWSLLGQYFKHRLQIWRGEVAGGLAGMRTALAQLDAMGFALRVVAYHGDLAEALGQAGRWQEGLEVIDQALRRAEANGARWCGSELLRIKGELLLQEGGAGCLQAAEAFFCQAQEMAAGQGALSWELRAVISLARLWQLTGRATDAHALLSETLGRFTEGFATADLMRAQRLLSALAPDGAVPLQFHVAECGAGAVTAGGNPQAPYPPSIASTAPVTKDASGLARNKMPAATSSGRP